MALGTSLFLIAVGAILRYAVHTSVEGFSIHTVGVILMIVGVLGALISLFWMTVWARRGGGGGYHDRDYPPPGP